MIGKTALILQSMLHAPLCVMPTFSAILARGIGWSALSSVLATMVTRSVTLYVSFVMLSSLLKIIPISLGVRMQNSEKNSRIGLRLSRVERSKLELLAEGRSISVTVRKLIMEARPPEPAWEAPSDER